MIDGFKNEQIFISNINGRPFKIQNLLLQDLLKELYPKIKDDDIVYAYKYGKYAKTDMVLEVNGKKKGISIKKGIKNSVHLEHVNKFLNKYWYLPSKFKYEFLKYIYADGTTNNSGIKRLSAKEHIENNYENVYYLKEKLNKMKFKLLIRFLIIADIKYKIPVDAFIHGEYEDFIWATAEEVLEHLMNKELNLKENGLSVSNLYIQSWNKNIIRNPKYEYCRHYFQVKWYNMPDDIIEIMNKRAKNMQKNTKNRKKLKKF